MAWCELLVPPWCWLFSQNSTPWSVVGLFYNRNGQLAQTCAWYFSSFTRICYKFLLCLGQEIGGTTSSSPTNHRSHDWARNGQEWTQKERQGTWRRSLSDKDRNYKNNFRQIQDFFSIMRRCLIISQCKACSSFRMFRFRPGQNQAGFDLIMYRVIICKVLTCSTGHTDLISFHYL